MDLKIYENAITIAAMQTLRVLCGLEPLESGMLKKALKNSC